MCSKPSDYDDSSFFEPISDQDTAFPPCNDSIYIPRSAGYAKPRVPTCMCSKDCAQKTVDAPGPNEGRQFFACAARKCKYFRWVDSLTPYANILKKVTWAKCTEPEYKLYRSSISKFNACDIVQGKLGDCWFLSALAVVAEKADIIARLFPIPPSSDCLYVSLFINGKRDCISIDKYFPVINGSFVFSKAVANQIWVSAAEKAYAKAYGGYSRISGGEVAEALFDITGCPVESLDVDACKEDPEAADELWTRLLSLHSSGFLLGCGTSVGSSGDGIASFHAYSILDVTELTDVIVGKQKTIHDYFKATPSANDTKPEQVVRLLKIRNPWGQYEWKGDWSAKSEKWTTSLSGNLGNTTKNDGCFFMEFSDFIQNFQVVDTCKTHSDWYDLTVDLQLGAQHLELRAIEYTWMYIMVVQPSLRSALTKSKSYAAFGILVRDAVGDVIASLVPGCRRVSILECMLPVGDYSVNLPTLACESGSSVVIRVYSAHAVFAQIAKSIETAAFPLPFISKQAKLIQIQRVTENLVLEIREAFGIVYFIVIERDCLDSDCQLQMDVRVIDIHNKLILLGPWVYKSSARDSKELVGLLRSSRQRYDSERVTGYSFELDVYPVGNFKRRKF